MPSSVAAICNQALSALALDADIQVITENSAEARACNLFYEDVRDQVLRDFPWPFARKVAVLALVTGTPNEWGYQYRYPSDALAIRRILPYGDDTATLGQLEFPSTRIPYSIAQDATGRLLWTFMEDAWVEYTVQITDVTMFPDDFAAAVALLLASFIAPRVTGGDPNKLGDRALAKYQWRISSAKANALNEQAPDLPTDSDFITSRG